MSESDMQVAKRAVRLASALCQTVQRQLAVGETASKADKSPVTVADYGAQVLVSWSLEKAVGPISLVAEEDSNDLREESGSSMLSRITNLVNETLNKSGEEDSLVSLSEKEVIEAIDRGGSLGGPKGKHWVLDPIDGTKGFVRGEQYAVALGLLEEGEVVLGVLGCPNLPLSSLSPDSSDSKKGCLFTAMKGKGTFLEPLDGSEPPKRVHVTAVDDPAWAVFCESYESAHSKQDLTANISRVLGVSAPPVRMDSQAKYGAMARGDAAIYLRFPHKGYREKIWDHAAGAICITEAGGVVSDASGAPLDFSQGRFLDLDTGIVASNKPLMPVLLAAVQTCLKGEQP